MSGSLLFISALISAVSDGAYALLTGLLLASIWLPGQEKALRRTLHRLSILGLVVLTGCDLLRPGVLAASMSGSLKLSDMLPAIPQVLLQTHQGTIWFIQTGAIALLATAFAFRERRLRDILIALFLLVLAFCKAASGHAADEGDFTLSEILQMLHILATAVWAGGVAVSAFAVFPRIMKPGEAELGVGYAMKLSNAATVAVGVLAVTGVYTAARETNEAISALWTSTWGRVLAAKIVFVTAALAMGAFNRFACLRAPVAREKIGTLARVLMFEAIALSIAIAVSGLLGSLPPPESS